MRAKTLTLLFVLCYSGVVFSACSGSFDFECFYDVLFGDDESSEESVEQSHHAHLNHSAKDLSSVIQDTDEKLEEIPKILGYLKNLTRTVTHVQHVLIGTKLSSNEIEKEEESKKLHAKKDSLSSESSEEKSTKDDKKKVKIVDKDSPSDLKEIPRLASDVAKLTEMMKSVIEQINKNKPSSKLSEVGKSEEKEEASKQSDNKAAEESSGEKGKEKEKEEKSKEKE